MEYIEQRVLPTRFFHQLDEQLQLNLLELGERTTHHRGDIVFHSGESNKSLHILLDGRAKVYRLGHGRKLCLSILQSGDLFGELSMLDDNQTSASIAATQTCDVLSLDKEVVFDFLQSNPYFLREFLEYVSLRLRNVINDVCSIALDDVYGRLRRVLLRLAAENGEGDRLATITHLELAEMIGCSREMVSIIIKELRTGNYLRTDGRTITLLRELPEKR